jgi:hypothetical protein
MIGVQETRLELRWDLAGFKILTHIFEYSVGHHQVRGGPSRPAAGNHEVSAFSEKMSFSTESADPRPESVNHFSILFIAKK